MMPVFGENTLNGSKNLYEGRAGGRRKPTLASRMKSVRTVRQPQASVVTLASFAVPAGQKQIFRT
jgi:hypothetical protein